MSVQFLEALATDLLENENLVSLCIIIENRGLDHCPVNIGSAYADLSFVIDEEDFVELHTGTVCSRKAVAKDFFSSFYFELLACNVYDCVHKNFV